MIKVGDKIDGKEVIALSADGKMATLKNADGTTVEAVIQVAAAPAAPAPVVPVVRNRSMLEATTDTSLNDRMAAVERAVSLLYGQGLSGYAYAHLVFDDYVIVCKLNQQARTYWKVGYTLDTMGVATLVGDPKAVKNVWKELGTTESWRTTGIGGVFGPIADDDTGQIQEADAKPTGKKWSVLIIQEGKSKNRNNYGRKVLQEAAALYEGQRMFLDHQEETRRYGRSTKDVAGFIKDVAPVLLKQTTAEGQVIEGAGPILALAATAVITKATVREEMLDAWVEGKADLYGLSHDVMAESVTVAAPEGAYYDVTRIESVKSVDLVVNPAAGGRVMRLVASDTVAETLAKDEQMLKKMIEAIKGSKNAELIAALEALGATPNEDQVMALYQKLGAAAPRQEATPPAAQAPAAPAAPATGAVANVTEAEFRESVQDGRLSFLRESLAGCSLPQLVKDQISTAFTASITEATTVAAVPAKKTITEAIKAQVDLFGKLAEGGVMVPSAGHRVTTGASRGDKLREGLDAFFGVKVTGKVKDATTGVERETLELLPTGRRVESFKQLYVEITGDRNVTGHVREAVTIKEALDSTTFDQALGDSITRRMLAEYANAPQAMWRGTIAEVVPVSDFRVQRRIRFGGYPNLSTVGQGGAYPALTSPTDEEATYSPAKRGGTEQITIEMIANDDVGVIRRIPLRLARAASQTLYEFVFDFMRTNAVIYDSTALAASRSGQVNISTTALSATQVSTLRNLIKKMADMSNSKRIGLNAKYLWVPTDLEELAFQICTSDRAVPDASLAAQAAPAAPNFINRIGITPRVVDYWTDLNNYWLTTDVAQTPMIEIGFLGGREEPELFVADLPNAGSLFSNDQITYKIRHVYGGGVMDFRGFAGGIVA